MLKKTNDLINKISNDILKKEDETFYVFLSDIFPNGVPDDSEVVTKIMSNFDELISDHEFNRHTSNSDVIFFTESSELDALGFLSINGGSLSEDELKMFLEDVVENCDNINIMESNPNLEQLLKSKIQELMSDYYAGIDFITKTIECVKNK